MIEAGVSVAQGIAASGAGLGQEIMSSQTLARIGYVAPMVAYPVSAAAESETRSNLLWDWREVPIRDGRDIPGGARLDRHGFAVVPHASAVADFGLNPDWLDRYAREIEEIVRQISGARDVIVPEMKLTVDG